MTNNSLLAGATMAAAADDIRGMIGHRSFYAGLFAFVMNHEPDLIDFCQDRNIDATWTRRCYELFAGESVPWL